MAFFSLGSDVADSDSEDPQVYESMCNIQAQSGSSETAQSSDQGNNTQVLQSRGSTKYPIHNLSPHFSRIQSKLFLRYYLYFATGVLTMWNWRHVPLWKP